VACDTNRQVTKHAQFLGMMDRVIPSLTAGTIVDATIITALTWMKHATQARDPATTQTQKGNQWCFGMKVHVGSDARGIVHTVTTTDAATADIKQLDDISHEQERTLFGDQADWKQDDKTHWEASGGIYRSNRRGKRTANWDRIIQARSRTRCRIEHVLHVVKGFWGYTKVRYCGMAKNTTRVLATFALANLYVLRRNLELQGT
jgi:transposase, IS5 family